MKLTFLRLVTALAFAAAGTAAAALQPPEQLSPSPPNSAAAVDAADGQPARTLSDLRRRLTQHVNQPKYTAAMWGVKVVSLDTGKTVFEHNAQKLFTPASNTKLYTVGLALDRLGADYRIKTSLYAASKPDSTGTIQGDLLIYGRGDPTFNARLHNQDIFAALRALVDVLTNAGVKRITGDLVGDESYFRGPPFGTGWTCDDLENFYGAEISALTINDNTVQLSVLPAGQPGVSCRLWVEPPTPLMTLSNRTTTVRKGLPQTIHLYRPLNDNLIFVMGQMPADAAGYWEDVPVHNPALLFVSLLKEAMVVNGIALAGKVRTMGWLDRQVSPIVFDNLTELGSASSMPLRELAKEILKPSQNLYADLLLAHLGEKFNHEQRSATETSEELGINELGNFISRAGIKSGEAILEEGSGLSRNNLATPAATVTLLLFMARQSSAAVYLEALPVAGVDGTLANRMKGTAAEGNVRAKTGTLKWVHALAGHVTTAAGERLIFSIMLNRFKNPDPDLSARADVDAIALMLAEFKGRSDVER